MTAIAAGSAHLTGTAGVTCPTVFEILSQQGFSNALKPAVAHVVKVLAELDPGGRFAVIYRYFDELYLAFDAVVQWHYILTRGATLSEAFYGMERKLLGQDHKLFRIRLSYMLSVVVPYLSSKLEYWHKLQTEETTEMQNQRQDGQDEDFRHSAQFSRIMSYYPLVKTTCRVVNIYYLLAYTFGRSEYHSLTFKLLNMTLGYTSEKRTTFMESKYAELWTASAWADARKAPKLVLRSLGESVLFMVEIGTFFIQFLEWWYNDPRRARVGVTTVAIPPPPQLSEKQNSVQTFVKFSPAELNKCPICRREFRNSTAISVSGMVYCYGCIFPLLKEEGCCPLSRLPCNINHLIRLYQ